MESSFYPSYFNKDALSYSVSVSFILSIIGASTKVSKDTTASKLQRICKICSFNFKESLISKKSNKKVCKFCYEATCNSCSLLKISKSHGEKKKRICISCLNTSIKEYFKKTISSKYAIDRLSQSAEEEKKNDSEYLEALKNLCELKKLEVDEMEQEAEEIRKDCGKDEDLRIEHNENLMMLKTELEREQRECKKMAQVIEQGQEKVRELKHEIERFRVLEEEFKASNAKSIVNQVPKLNLNVIRDQIYALTGLKNCYLHDISNLKKKNEELISAQSCTAF